LALTGVVFVPAVEVRDLESRATRLAETAPDVYEAIVEIDEPR
jgi:hypothetical protein